MSLRNSMALMALPVCLIGLGNSPRIEVRQPGPLAGIEGEYYFGNGLGIKCSLKVEPGGRFVFERRGCLGLDERNQGIARLVFGHVLLTPEDPNEQIGIVSGIATDFVYVRWGNRSYLIPEDRKKEFCTAVNEGQEPRRGGQ